MKKLIITNLYGEYARGGAESVVAQQVDREKEKGNEAVILTARPWKDSSLVPKKTTINESLREETKERRSNLISPNEEIASQARNDVSKKSAKKEKELIGIEITAQPPGKRIKDINILSGGERALTSVALICAILTVSPSPFVVLDEVDAALDEANSIRYAEILEKLSHTTQFIVVTHNRASMQKSKVLYGVTMGDDGVSQLLSVELEKAAAWAK